LTARFGKTAQDARRSWLGDLRIKQKFFNINATNFNIASSLWYAKRGGGLMIKSESHLLNRDLYLKRLIAFQDTEPVKITFTQDGIKLITLTDFLLEQ
jgi:hypothetical protein